jgi:allophanate hydrolase
MLLLPLVVAAGGDAMAAASAAAFAAAVERLQGCGGSLVAIDFSPFAQAAALLYQSSFVAERYSGLRSFLDQPHAAEVQGAQALAAAGVAADPVAAALLQQRSLASDQRLMPVTRAIISGAGAGAGGESAHASLHAVPVCCCR